MKEYKKYIKFILRYKKRHFIAALFMLIQALLVIVKPYILMQLIDKIIPQKDLERLIQTIILYVAVIIVENISTLISEYMYAVIGKNIVNDLRGEIVTHIQKMSGKYFCSMDSGELLTTVNEDVATVEDFATTMIFSIISDIVTAVIMFVFLCRLQLDLLIAAVILQPVIFYLQRLFNGKINKNVSDLRNTYGKYTSVVDEFFNDTMSFVNQNAKDFFTKKYNQVANEFLKIGIKLQLNFAKSKISTRILSGLITVIILGYGGYKVMIGAMTIGALVTFNSYAQQLISPVFRIAQLKMNLQETQIALQRIIKVLEEPIEIEDDENGYIPEELKGNIEFKDVVFGYTEDKNVLNGLNITFGNNRTSAIVGSSGGGKTTIVSLLFRLWDIKEGTILLDDVDIRKYNLSYLRKQISIVSQDVYIFNDTIHNNLVLENKDITMAEVINVTKQIGIYDFIMTLPEQFESSVGQRGITLSGGQKQRISIARALLKNAPIVILDEATSALDNLSEGLIKNEFVNIFKDKTVLMIAHRLSSIEDADIIYVLKDGKVVEQGNQTELMSKHAIYYSMYIKEQSNDDTEIEYSKS